MFVEHMAFIEVSTSEDIRGRVACRPTAYRPDGHSKVWVCQASHEQATSHATLAVDCVRIRSLSGISSDSGYLFKSQCHASKY